MPFPTVSRIFHHFYRVCHLIFHFIEGPHKASPARQLSQLPLKIAAWRRMPDVHVRPSSSCNPHAATGSCESESTDFHVLFTMRKKKFHGGLLRSLGTSPSLTMSNFALRETGRDKMNSTERLTCGSIIAGFPPLRQPQPETADRGAVRLGSGCITAAFPPRR